MLNSGSLSPRIEVPHQNIFLDLKLHCMSKNISHFMHIFISVPQPICHSQPGISELVITVQHGKKILSCQWILSPLFHDWEHKPKATYVSKKPGCVQDVLSQYRKLDYQRENSGCSSEPKNFPALRFHSQLLLPWQCQNWHWLPDTLGHLSELYKEKYALIRDKFIFRNLIIHLKSLQTA